MENNSENNPQEEINNPEQFQVGRTPQEEKENNESDNSGDDAEYTPEETEFADGKGSKLNEAIKQSGEETPDEELKEKTDGTFEDQDFGKSEGLQPELNDI